MIILSFFNIILKNNRESIDNLCGTHERIHADNVIPVYDTLILKSVFCYK